VLPGHSPQLVAPDFEYVPAEHNVQLDDPELSEYVPAAHDVHTPALLTYEPAGHVVQLAAPATEVDPVGHVAQLVAPVADEYDPAEHNVQLVAPAAEYEPAEHNVQLVAPAAEYEPAAHDVQVADIIPVDEEYPAGHGVVAIVPIIQLLLIVSKNAPVIHAIEKSGVASEGETIPETIKLGWI